MSIISRFARSRDPEVSVPEVAADCAHRDLAPRWDNAADMGKKEKITSFTCSSCKESFSPQEAESLAVV
jgi:hypothetical protein